MKFTIPAITKIKFLHLLWYGILFTLQSCGEFVEVEPPKTQLGGTEVFTSDATAVSALTGIYIRMMDNFGHFANYHATLYAGLSADELENLSTSADRGELYNNSLQPTNGSVSGLWSDLYEVIYHANAVLEGLEASETVTSATRQQLAGEAGFIRAFCHFYLVNFFGKVPYVTTTDYRVNATIPAIPVAEVYEKIIADLEEAQTLLGDDYAVSGGERVRPNSYTATALLARVYLYLGEWAQAEALATQLIGHPELYRMETGPGRVFLAGSTEAIWQLKPVIEGFNTIEGYNLNCCVPTNAILGSTLLNAFETGDRRYTDWVGSLAVGTEEYRYPNKYKVSFSPSLTEYYMVFRLAEQYLVRAEARAQQGNITGAQQDLNVVRNRAGLENTTAVTQAALLDAVMHERKVELFAEWGHRWFDLKRTGRADAILGVLNPGWQPTDALYPIPQTQLLNNPNTEQNPGY